MAAAAKPFVVITIAFLLAAVAALPLPDSGGGDLPPFPLRPAEAPAASLPDGGGGGGKPPFTLLPPHPAGCRGSVGMCPAASDEAPGLGANNKGATISTMSADPEPFRRRVPHQQRDSVPCSRRGASYYNCRPGALANPYRRTCSRIKNCHG